jgi:phosphatidate phosphatase PAH1
MFKGGKAKVSKLLKKPSKAASVDILLVEQKDGTLKSSPFYILFPRNKLLTDKEISISINDELLPFKMYLKKQTRSPIFGTNSDNPPPNEILPLLLKWRNWFLQPKNKFRFLKFF